MSLERSSNAADVYADFVAAVASFGFRSSLEGKVLGEVIVEETAHGISERSRDTRSAPSSGRWDENAPKYRKRKVRRYGVGEPNTRTGQMLSALSVKGEYTIADREITIVYGINKPPANGFDEDKKRTDREKAHFAHTGQSEKKILRPFFELDEEHCDATLKRCEESLDTHLRENWH
jgi:hypothetical protein